MSITVKLNFAQTNDAELATPATELTGAQPWIGRTGSEAKKRGCGYECPL